MSRESELYPQLQLAATQAGHRLFRFQVGTFWQGSAQEIRAPCTHTLRPGDVILRGARRIHCGVAGMSDEMGWTQTVITPAHVGRTLPVFTSVEAKGAKTPTTKEQAAWINMVRLHHGVAGIVRSVDDYRALIRPV